MIKDDNQIRTGRPYRRPVASLSDFDAVRINLATRHDILEWSYGEVLKSETINYRTQKYEKDGLFCEKIFGPKSDINPSSTQYQSVRVREKAVDKAGNLVTKRVSRRQRMGHISLVSPVVHIWFLKTLPSPIQLISNISIRDLEKVIYLTSYLILEIETEKIKELLEEANKDLEDLQKVITDSKEQLSKIASKAEDKARAKIESEIEELETQHSNLVSKSDLLARLSNLEQYNLLSESAYRNLPSNLQSLVKVEMGGQAIYEMLKNIDISQLIEELNEELKEVKSVGSRTMIVKRLRQLELMKAIDFKIEDMCLTVLPVTPPDMRPIMPLQSGQIVKTDINDLYRRVINRNNQLKKLIEEDAPNIIIASGKRTLQEAVDALFDNSSTRNSNPSLDVDGRRRVLKSLTDSLKGKRGRFRQNLLGKRVDYSGRSVIVSGPKLRMDECGIPKTMALELFRPFVVGQIIAQEQAKNLRVAYRIIESQQELVWDALDKVIQGRHVLLNRAPTLHRLSIQAFKPVLIEGQAIRLPALVCKGFNADFDGDAMAVHLPLSDKAQLEAREIMKPSQNLLNPATGDPVLHLDQDIVFGLYYLTYDRYQSQKPTRAFISPAEAIFAFDAGQINHQTPIKIRFRGQNLTTTLGRIFFNEIFPEDFPFQNRTIDKAAIQEVMSIVYEKYDNKTTAILADNIKDCGFKHSTLSGLSIGMKDLDFIKAEDLNEIVHEGRKRIGKIRGQFNQGLITDEERYRLVIAVWDEIDGKVLEKVSTEFVKKETGLKIMVDSGARGKINMNQVKNMTASIGLLNDASNQIIELPVNRGYSAGLRSLEYFIAARGGRKSLIGTQLSTADSGYLSRRLVYVAQDVVTLADDQGQRDPGFVFTRENTASIFKSLTLGDRLVGRCSAEDVVFEGEEIVKTGELITKQIAAKIDEINLDQIRIMSVLSAPNLDGIPPKSYGIDLANNTELVRPDTPIGIIAAQSVGEPSTQLKLDSKHTGGAAVITQNTVATGLNRVEELFEVRIPRGHCYLAVVDGQVVVNETETFYRVSVALDMGKTILFDCQKEGRVLVKVGDHIKPNKVIGVKPDNSVITNYLGGEVVSIDDNKIEIKPTASMTPFDFEVKPDSKVLVKVDDIVGFDQTIIVEADKTEVKSQFSGRVVKVNEEMVIIESIVVDQCRIPIYQQLLVENGDFIKRGDKITEGSSQLDQLLALKGTRFTQNYILTEISRIFALQGNNISDKHLEVIIRSMFSRVQIADGGDSKFVDSDFVPKLTLLKANQELIEAGKRPATWRQLVLGISKVTMTSDSFLSAAGFQNIKQVLVGSAVRGRIDPLVGLLENVMIGRLIPVGTGAKSQGEVEYRITKPGGSDSNLFDLSPEN